MPDFLHTILWPCLAAFAAGMMNALAGGGTLLTFPALLTVLSPVVANGTSTVALMPGSVASAWGYRRQLRAAAGRVLFLIGPSLAGGAAGTLLVTRLEEEYFRALIPWLILAATLLFLVQPLVARLVRAGAGHGPPSAAGLAAVGLFQFLVGVYGGYFGAGIGILMLSALALMGLADIHQMNALKSFLALCINGTAAALFAAEGKVEWRYALVMAASAVVGGYLGARLALRLKPGVVRWIVIAVGLGLAGYFFCQQPGPRP